jgi:seryl-tRNA synthetase
VLDGKLVENDPDAVRAALVKRNADDATLAKLDELAGLGERRKALMQETEACKATRNSLSPKIGAFMREGKRDEADALKLQVKAASERAKELDAELAGVEGARNGILEGLPNLVDARVPNGANEDDNVQVRAWGDKPTFDFEPKTHDVLGTELGGLDFERAAKLSGTRFAVLRGQVARLERALINFFIDLHTADHGYTELMVPYIVSRETMRGTGQLPKFEDDLFALNAKLSGEDAFLIPTAEVPVTNLHAREIIDADQLPLAYVAFTPCFRAEAGSYGRDTKGLIRQHQFHKVELVRIAAPEDSDAQHEALTNHAEAVLQALGLHYRVMRLCGGDLSFAARHCYDLEVWLPGQGAFREISSCSTFGDFQARRMSLRYRPEQTGKKKAKPRFAHTINGSGLAVGRTVVAVLENYQQEDGTVVVPEVLRPYMGGLERIG